MVKINGEWQTVDWETALEATVNGMRSLIHQHGADQVGVLVSPTATLEEMSLLQALARGIGTSNIDHRLRQADFTDQAEAPLCPSLGLSLEALERVDAALVIGGNPRKDQPIAGHRLRKAAIAGAKVMFVNPADFEFLFDVHASCIVPPSRMAEALAGVAAALPTATPADAVKPVIAAASPDESQRAIAAALKKAENAVVLLGNIATAHPQYSLIRALADVIADATGATLGILPEAANSVGGWLAGVLPHRGPAGEPLASSGMNAREMIEQSREGYLLFGVEPAHDCMNPAQASKAVADAEFVVAITAFASEALRNSADILLPIGPFTETSGTFVNAEGRWQSFAGVASPVGESRPGWKVLRVLGNQFGLDGFEQTGSEQVRDALRTALGEMTFDNHQAAGPVASATPGSGLERVGDVAIHAIDPLVRRAGALQRTPDSIAAGKVRMNAAQAKALGISGAEQVKVSQGDDASAVLELQLDATVPDGCVRIQSGTPAAATLGAAFGPISVERA
jgi:NADH-quinone oxidoreductase subunit G